MSDKRIKITSEVCPQCKEVEIIEVSEEGYRSWRRGELIQRAMPELTIDQRERLKTGLHGECWNKWLGPEPEE